MELIQLYQSLELPSSVIDKLISYNKNRKSELDNTTKAMIANRETWDDGIKKLQEFVGNDPDGIKILWELLNLSLESYERYLQRGISTQIYFDTMKFCTRFIEEHYRIFGEYKFAWAWWFPRQLALLEFRIGCLEYEFIEADQNIISIHIPSDANLQKNIVAQSIKDFKDFCEIHFPDWINAKLYCESWLLSPALKELLDENSNILNFQELFTVESVDYESNAVLDWVFPGNTEISDQLQENTSLQRDMKKYLMQGKKIGWAKGVLKEAF